MDSSRPNDRTDPRLVSVTEAMGLPPTERFEYFDRVRINHPRLSATLREVEQCVYPTPSSNLILLVGPPGVGKSMVIELLHEGVIKKHRAEMLQDPGFLPIAVLNAGSSGDQRFSWRSFYLYLLKVLGGQPQSTLGDLQRSVEQSLYNRRTGILVVDEAVHMLRGASGPAVLRQIEALKSMASMVGVTIVLVGAYDLVNIPALSGQIARRSMLIHFPRYQQHVSAEVVVFRRIIEELVAKFPVNGANDLILVANEIQRCVNCCAGVLKKLLLDSLRRALFQGADWNMEHFCAALPTAAQLDVMIRETEQGENLLATTEFDSKSWDALHALKTALVVKKGSK